MAEGVGRRKGRDAGPVSRWVGGWGWGGGSGVVVWLFGDWFVGWEGGGVGWFDCVVFGGIGFVCLYVGFVLFCLLFGFGFRGLGLFVCLLILLIFIVLCWDN